MQMVVKLTPGLLQYNNNPGVKLTKPSRKTLDGGTFENTSDRKFAYTVFP